MKKIILLIILIFMTSCTKFSDLKNISIIKSIGIDYDNEYIIYAQIYDEIEKNSVPKTKNIIARDKDIINAFKSIKQLSNKEIFFSHIDLLILSTKLKDNNYQEIINYFIQDNNFRNDFLCIFSDNIKNLIDNTKYNEIEDMFKSNIDIKRTLNITFNELANNYLENNEIKLSKVSYDKNKLILSNYRFKNNIIERISNEKN